MDSSVIIISVSLIVIIIIGLIGGFFYFNRKIDCKYSWNEWSNCDNSGNRYRDPNISVEAKNGGSACPTRQIQACLMGINYSSNNQFVKNSFEYISLILYIYIINFAIINKMTNSTVISDRLNNYDLTNYKTYLTNSITTLTTNYNNSPKSTNHTLIYNVAKTYYESMSEIINIISNMICDNNKINGNKLKILLNNLANLFYNNSTFNSTIIGININDVNNNDLNMHSLIIAINKLIKVNLNNSACKIDYNRTIFSLINFIKILLNLSLNNLNNIDTNNISCSTLTLDNYKLSIKPKTSLLNSMNSYCVNNNISFTNFSSLMNLYLNAICTGNRINISETDLNNIQLTLFANIPDSNTFTFIETLKIDTKNVEIALEILKKNFPIYIKYLCNNCNFSTLNISIVKNGIIDILSTYINVNQTSQTMILSINNKINILFGEIIPNSANLTNAITRFTQTLGTINMQSIISNSNTPEIFITNTQFISKMNIILNSLN